MSLKNTFITKNNPQSLIRLLYNLVLYLWEICDVGVEQNEFTCPWTCDKNPKRMR